MTVAVLADNVQWEEVVNMPAAIEWKRMNDSAAPWPEADAYFLLTTGLAVTIFELRKPVLINSVIDTLTQFNLPHNVVRMNGWSGFINRNTWEIAGTITPELNDLFLAMNKKPVVVKDEPDSLPQEPLQ